MSFARRHPVLVISVVTAVAMVSGTTAWAVSYDQRSSQTLLPGTVVGGVPVAGLGEAQAVSAVRASVEDPLHRRIHVQTESFETDTTAWDLGLKVDVPSAVSGAMGHSHQGNLFQRVWRRVFGHPSNSVAVTPKWGSGAVSGILDQATEAVKIEPHNAKIDTSSGFVSLVAPKTGRQLDVDKSRDALLEAAKTGKSSVDFVTTPVEPEVGADAFSKVILVRTGENKLYLYENGQITKTYPVATGQAIFPTPTGTWHVIQKLVNPTWVNPNSNWSTSMPATIGPGPGNPLGDHALALDASGILIHATSDDASIGFSASHGCIRMHASDELDLFGRVGTGTTVAIVNGGAPAPRPGDTPAPVTPDQNAAVNY
ncbi:MAG: L,D-transpeptidase/peptidoglycan binding protein [Actinomycetota bacterium]|nr:L,D-transpeptidase/peptidoglycan binding protein [Actinomycetota bacterium]